MWPTTTCTADAPTATSSEPLHPPTRSCARRSHGLCRHRLPPRHPARPPAHRSLARSVGRACARALSLLQGFIEDYTLSIQNGEEQSDEEDERGGDGDSISFVTLLEVCTFSRLASLETLHTLSTVVSRSFIQQMY